MLIRIQHGGFGGYEEMFRHCTAGSVGDSAPIGDRSVDSRMAQERHRPTVRNTLATSGTLMWNCFRAYPEGSAFKGKHPGDLPETYIFEIIKVLDPKANL